MNFDLPRFSSARRAATLDIESLALCLAAGLLLAGCDTFRSFEALKPGETIPVTGIAEAIGKESGKLADNYDALMKDLNRLAKEEHMRPVAPHYDPLENKIVSLIMHNADIGKILYALEGQVGLNMIVDPLVMQGDIRTSLYLKKVSAREMFDHILGACDLYGEIRNNALIVSLFEERIFNAGFLGANMSIDLASGGDVFGGNSGNSGSGSSGGDTLRSDFTIRGNTSKQIDSYEELENAIKQILGLGDDRASTQKRQAANAATGALPPALAAQNAASTLALAQNMMTQAAQAAPAPNAAQNGSALPPVSFSLNRATGSLYVKARPSQVRSIAHLLEHNKAALRRQVQVEAQLIDVQLNDGYQFGVDWTVLRRNLAGSLGLPMQMQDGTVTLPDGNLLGRSITIPARTLGPTAGSGLGLTYGDDRFSATLKALSSFGTLRILSNPSIRVRNGAPALLSVGTNIRYVAKSSSSTSVPGGGASTTSSEVETDALFSGVVVGVVPYIHETGRIELLVHPMQTEVVPESLQLIPVGGGNVVTLPMVNYKGVTTTLNLADGDMVMIGGLIDQNRSTDKNGIPGLSDIPGIGNVLGEQSSSHNSRELVVVLRVRLM
ncbi:MAG: pilus (MSHA type) biogenesis protein MshL [Candidatus Accumulibacter sp.]|jgi:general secretion pathway protein D|nr:pilus (MSHA type) biogenesis protein MshL [Accumulibacter sp.]